MYVKKKTFEIQLTSEEVVEKLASKVENDASVADFVKSKPLNTEVTFSLVPGNFPNNIVISRTGVPSSLQRPTLEPQKMVRKLIFFF